VFSVHPATLACALMALSLPALGQSVALSGLMGTRALLVVDGKPPRSLAPGDQHQGVKLLSTGNGEAVIEIAGKRHTLRLGEAPVSVGTQQDEGKGARIVLTASSGGHFVTGGQINGKQVRLLVDTGASMVALSVAVATELGLDSVRVADVTVFGVDAVVLPESIPYVLLGNSYLGRFQMTRDNDQLLLSRRY
jgi:aspartyl protease family protein